jgi:glycosyltransferase involved in cell wall biosynthesis
MRIAWFSPLPPQPSGISEYSLGIVRSLVNYCDLDLWTEGEVHRDILPVRSVYRYDLMPMADVLSKLKEYNAVVYNMGNNHLYHSHMYEILDSFPGIVILHDYVMHHFFLGYYRERKKSMESYFNLIRAYYGIEGEREVVESLKKGKGVHEDDRVLSYPLCEPIILRSLGLVVHTEFARSRIEPFALCPTSLIRHPLLSLEVKEEDFYFEKEKFYIFIGGEITPNKLVDRIITAFARYPRLSELKSRIRILVVGPDRTGRLESLIKEHRLEDIFIYLGHREEHLFNFYISNANMCINLRYPTMGESSGVLIRCLQFGKPTIVTRVGFYDEIPDEAVIKIPYGRESEIPKIVEDYIRNPYYEEVGIRGKSYVYKEHSLEKYIIKLIELIDKSKAFLPYNLLTRDCLDILKKISHCPRGGYKMRIIDEVSEIISQIIGQHG